MSSAEPSVAFDGAVEAEQDPGEFSGPLEWYWHFSQRNDFQTDSEQLRVLGRLERLFEELEEYRQYRAGRGPVRGQYLSAWLDQPAGHSARAADWHRLGPVRRWQDCYPGRSRDSLQHVLE